LAIKTDDNSSFALHGEQQSAYQQKRNQIKKNAASLEFHHQFSGTAASGSLGACSALGSVGCGATNSSGGGAAGAVSTTGCVLTGAKLGDDS
jgi:hypothetical protein